MRAPLRVFGYARVSSAEQALGTSLEDQQNVIRAYAKKRGLDVTRIYAEAESAVHEKAEKREQVRFLMSEVREGDLVLVDKLDRWSRDPEFTYGSIRQILERSAGFFAIGDNCDPSTRDGDTMLGVRVLVAREEHKRIKERMVGARKLLRNRGYCVEGLPPFGYHRQNVKGIDRNVLVLDQATSAKLRDAFRRCIAGESLMEIESALGISRDRVQKMLRHRLYLGEMKDSTGQWKPGKHEALVDARTFRDAGLALDRRRQGHRRPIESSETASWWLRDIARCALCGAKMTSAYGGTPLARRYYFLCYQRCTRRLVPVRVAESQCEPMVLTRLAELRAELASPGPVAAPSAKPDVKTMREKLEQKRARAVEAFVDGGPSREQFRATLARLDTERTKLDALVMEPDVVTPAQTKRVLREVGALRAGWSKMTTIERKDAVRLMARAVLLAADKLPTFDWVSVEELARRT